MKPEEMKPENFETFDMLMKMAGEVKRDLCTGKKVLVHGRQWIVFYQVTPTLFLAVESGSKPPCPVYAIKAERQDFA